MAKLKLLKYPKQPRLPKKPKATASLTSKQAYIHRVATLKKTYADKCRHVDTENRKRNSDNKKSEQLSKVIANISSVTTARTGTTHKRRKKAVHTKKGRKKAAPKKAAKRRRR